MKIWKYILKFLIIILLIFLIWQIILIILTIKENFRKIEYNPCDYKENLLNQRNRTIPRIIHQMWKTKDLSTYPINNSQSEWIKYYPNYEIRLWTDKDIEELFLKSEYKHLSNVYYSYIYSIQRSDLARLIILHYSGGIYSDLDVFPCSKQVEKLILTNYSFIIPLSTTSSSVINHFLLSEKSSPILYYILEQVKPKRFYEKIILVPYLEVFSTGAFFLTRILNQYIHLSTDSKTSLGILSDIDVTKYVTHEMGRSWHLIDGWILNLINDRPFLTFSLFSLFILFLYFIYKYSFLLTNISKQLLVNKYVQYD
ncbi:hypothetical protein I4U23_017319 [Adineta vaga]|nr:hypothetical protein I4U23_017319 [Adineta vaga]